MSNVNLIGFIHQYGENDFSVSIIQLSDEDKKAIEAITKKYETQGFSIRGNSLTIGLNEILRRNLL